MTNTPDHTTTSLDHIVVEKSKLLSTLRENRQTHKEIFDAACAGFWVQTEEALQKKKDEFTTALTSVSISFDKQFTTFSHAIEQKERKPLCSFSIEPGYSTSRFTLECSRNWLPEYPTNHLDDYDRAITMLEFSVADKVTLPANEFDAYVRNNWKWKEEFAASNLGFVRSVTGCLAASGGLSFSSSKTFAYAVSGAAAL